MYDELVKRLRNCISDTVEDCAGCPYQGGYKRTYCMNGLISEGADAIEELSRKYIEERNAAVELTGELAKMPFWIPVTERLPEDKERVLIFYWLSTKPKTPWYKVATFSTKLSDVDEYDLYGKDHPGFYGSDSEYGYYEHTDVEYWMPLPEPPKAEEGE